MMRSFTGVSMLAILLATASAHAQPAWQSAAEVEAGGQRVASLAFGVPQTDAQLLTASCRPDMPGQVQVWLNLPIAPETAPGAANIAFAVGRRVETRPALIEAAGSGDEKDGPRVSLVLGRDDPLWQLLMGGRSSRLSADNSIWVDMHLTGSRSAISQFLRSCDTLAETVRVAPDPAAQPQALVALNGPLFEVGDQPAEATSAFSGAPLPPFEPGTELMATGSSNLLDGEEWIEVRPGRGSGPAAWVRRSALTPVSGGAEAYQNLNQAANLMLRGAPNADASPVGAVPPRATVFDQGQRDGGWVLVRYGDVVGWASHEHLLPMLQPIAVDLPEGTEIPVEGLDGTAVGEPAEANGGSPDVTDETTAAAEDAAVAPEASGASADGPAETAEEPLESGEEPLESAGEPLESAEESVDDAGEPVQVAEEPAAAEEPAMADEPQDADGSAESPEVGDAEAEETAEAGEAGAGSYEEEHQGWVVSCDACASPEDTVCSLWSGSLPNSFAVVADENRPQRVGDLRIGMDLPPDPRGTLTVSVDGSQVVAIPPADITYMAMTGEFLLQPPYVDPILTTMIGGSTVAVAFLGADGTINSFSLPLAGFSAGITDLLTTSPQYSRDSACGM